MTSTIAHDNAVAPTVDPVATVLGHVRVPLTQLSGKELQQIFYGFVAQRIALLPCLIEVLSKLESTARDIAMRGRMANEPAWAKPSRDALRFDNEELRRHCADKQVVYLQMLGIPERPADPRRRRWLLLTEGGRLITISRQVYGLTPGLTSVISVSEASPELLASELERDRSLFARLMDSFAAVVAQAIREEKQLLNTLYNLQRGADAVRSCITS